MEAPGDHFLDGWLEGSGIGAGGLQVPPEHDLERRVPGVLVGGSFQDQGQEARRRTLDRFGQDEPCGLRPQGKRRLVTWTRGFGSFCFTGVPPGQYDIYYWGEDPDQRASDTVHGVFVRPLVKTSIRAWADVTDGAWIVNQRVSRP